MKKDDLVDALTVWYEVLLAVLVFGTFLAITHPVIWALSVLTQP